MRTRQKQLNLIYIVGLANAARAAFSETVLACLLRRGVVGLGELLEQRDDAVGLHHARVDDVDVDVVAIADSGKPLCKIRKGGVHRAADQKIRSRRFGRRAYNVDDTSMRCLEQWPEQPRQAHRSEERRVGKE